LGERGPGEAEIQTDFTKQLSVTEAARRISDLLDGVESEGESFVVVRHGRVATIAPALCGSGRALKEGTGGEPARSRVGRGAARAARLSRPRERPLARLILDTTVLVDTERGGAMALDQLVGESDEVAIAAITVAEPAVGVELADGTRRERRRTFVAAVLEAVSVEAYELEVARAHAALLAHTRRAGRARGAHEVIIAARARARRREVVSAELEGFAGLPEVVLRGER
jgi:tRNA(fMet)-specific endonuclease VapC